MALEDRLGLARRSWTESTVYTVVGVNGLLEHAQTKCPDYVDQSTGSQHGSQESPLDSDLSKRVALSPLIIQAELHHEGG